VRWVLSIMGYRNVQVICPTDTIRRRFVERGVPIERCHLIRPGIAFAKIRRRRDPALREALEIGPDDRVMLAPGESTRATAHEEALFAATVLNVMDRRNRLLVWGRGPRAEALRRFSARLQRPTFVDAHEMLRRPIALEELFSAADEVLVASTSPSVPTLPICACMAAALPIVAVVTPTIAELLEDRHTALLVGKASPRVIAQRVLDLREDPGLQWSISDMARTEAYEFFSLTRFVEQFRSAYEQLVIRNAIQIEQPAPGAGLRFHGRG
jgi:glycosyltransferase involved in cell wall biosynthesis